jgi:hypothetical protein
MSGRSEKLDAAISLTPYTNERPLVSLNPWKAASPFKIIHVDEDRLNKRTLIDQKAVG